MRGTEVSDTVLEGSAKEIVSNPQPASQSFPESNSKPMSAGTRTTSKDETRSQKKVQIAGKVKALYANLLFTLANYPHILHWGAKMHFY